MPTLRPHRVGHNGFSLAELLVAMVLVTILGVLAFGVSAKIRQGSKHTTEVSTLRQIGATLHLYIADHGGRLPQIGSPVAVKTLARQLGYIGDEKDWSNDSATPKNSIFRNGANEAAIRSLFKSTYDDRSRPDPLNTFAFSSYIGPDPAANPDDYAELVNVKTYLEVMRPSEKIYVVPGYFLSRYQERFAAATPNTPFRTANNPVEKGFFPALFADGHVAMVDPEPSGMTLNAINHRWLRPKSP